MRTMIIGIDPGLGGAVAAIDPDGALAGVWDTPAIKVGTKRDHLVGPMADLIRDLVAAATTGDMVAHVALERVGVRKGEGVSGAFKFGTGWGMWQGIAAAFQLPITLITPQRWKAIMVKGMPKDDKSISRLRACQLWPKHSDSFKRVMDDGRAEAALIGAAVRLELLGES